MYNNSTTKKVEQFLRSANFSGFSRKLALLMFCLVVWVGLATVFDILAGLEGITTEKASGLKDLSYLMQALMVLFYFYFAGVVDDAIAPAARVVPEGHYLRYLLYIGTSIYVYTTSRSAPPAAPADVADLFPALGEITAVLLLLMAVSVFLQKNPGVGERIAEKLGV